MNQPPPSLQKIDPATKNLIKYRISQAFPDALIIAEYTNKGFEISSEIIAKIRQESTPFVTSPTNIGELSNNADLVPSNFVPDKCSINPNAVVAVVTNEDGTVKSSLITGTTTPDPASGSIDKDTTIAVGSVTKMFTSAALLKLWDEELTATKNAKNANPSEELTEQPKNFPNGIDTPLSHFMDGLKEKFPDCTYLKTIEKAEHYPQVTLRDLLNHTHALGSRDEEKIAVAQMQDPSKRFSCSELVEFSKQDPKDKFGEFKYSNLGTELAGMVIELVTEKPFDKALKDLVLDPVGAKNTGIKGTEEAEKKTSSGYCYITPFTHERKEYSGEMNLNTAGNSMAAGGIKTTAEDGDKFIRKFLSETAGDTSLFQNREVVEALFQDKCKEGKHNICGVNKYKDEEGNVFYGHNGDNSLSEASLKFNPKTGEVVFYAAVGENLSFAVAYESLKKSGSEEPKLGEVLSRRDELREAGFDFSKMKSMVDKKMPFADIAEEAIRTLKVVKSKNSSEEVFSSQGLPSSSPRAPEQPSFINPPTSSPGR